MNRARQRLKKDFFMRQIWIGLWLCCLPMTALLAQSFCQDEIQPEAYRQCVKRYRQSVSQHLIESQMIEKLEQTRLPVLYPALSTFQRYLKPSLEKVYYRVNHTDKDIYTLQFNLTPFCEDPNTCTLGAWYVAKDTNHRRPNIQARLIGTSSRTHIKIRLEKHTTAWLERKDKAPSNNADAGWRTLTWKRGGVIYALTLKNADQEMFTEIANHLLEYGY